MKVQVPFNVRAWVRSEIVSYNEFTTFHDVVDVAEKSFLRGIDYANEQLTSKSPFLNDLEVHELGKELRGGVALTTKTPFLSDGDIANKVNSLPNMTNHYCIEWSEGARWARDKYEARDRGGDIGHSAEREKILMQFIESEYRLRQEQYNEMCDADCGTSNGEIDDGWVQLKNRIQTALNVPAVEPKWQPVFGMKCAFWNTGEAYTRTDLWVTYSSDFLTGMKVHKGQNHNHGQYCALLETLDEIGKPPQYFIERGRCTV
jgi:hypothetical protein